MNGASVPDLFLSAAKAENGMPISAGARVAHARAAIQSGRIMYVDLTNVPENERATIAAKIMELVRCASVDQSSLGPLATSPSQPSET